VILPFLRSNACITIGDIAKQYEILRNILCNETKDKNRGFLGSMLPVGVIRELSVDLLLKDLSSLPQLGREVLPEVWNRFLKYADRILFGSDLLPGVNG